MTSIWNKLKSPPVWALKQISAGRLKGKNDINPQWRYQIMTEVFGACGIGWKFEKVRQWTETGADGQIMCFVDVNLYIFIDGEWSYPIPGNGGDFLVKKESSGLYTNDEAFKMATTDALGAAMKMIGVAADIYLNKFDTKHERQESPAEPKKDADLPAWTNETTCTECDELISAAEYKFSMSNPKYKRPLCQKCQKKVSA